MNSSTNRSGDQSRSKTRSANPNHVPYNFHDEKTTREVRSRLLDMIVDSEQARRSEVSSPVVQR